MKKHSLLALGALVVLGALAVSPFVPKLVAAQTALIPTISSNCGGYAYSNNYSNCAPGVLHVYVVVSNEYQYGNQYAEQPANFTATVTSANSSPVSFPGSQSGTDLSVVGQYSVMANSLQNYTPTYSVGCTGSVLNGQQATCTITEGSGSTYTSQPVPYPYPYVQQTLSCTPSYQTVGLNQSVTFSIGGAFPGPFNWSTPNRTYQAIGPSLTTTFSTTGTQVVTVSSGTQIATCTVNVVAGATPASYVTPTTYVTPSAPILPSYYSTSPVSVTSNYVPSLPNTGYGPLSDTQIAMMLGALVALGIFLTPYVRNTLVAIG